MVQITIVTKDKFGQKSNVIYRTHYEEGPNVTKNPRDERPMGNWTLCDDGPMIRRTTRDKAPIGRRINVSYSP